MLIRSDESTTKKPQKLNRIYLIVECLTQMIDKEYQKYHMSMGINSYKLIKYDLRLI